jgi:hypothetical protein
LLLVVRAPRWALMPDVARRWLTRDIGRLLTVHLSVSETNRNKNKKALALVLHMSVGARSVTRTVSSRRQARGR